MTHWFISDTHFDHENMLKFLRDDGTPLRSFHSVQEMNETIISRWNEKVKPSDHIYHLGDLTMARGNHIKFIDQIMSRLNGHKRILLGNHDQLKSRWYQEKFEKVKAYHVENGIFFSHVPIHNQSLGKFKINVHGHTHERVVLDTLEYPDPRYLNICVEKTDYRPLSLEEIMVKVRT